MTTLNEIARALGGEISGRQVLAPGPGHSPRDRSLSVRLSPAAPDGFLTFSHCGDDWRECRDHVRRRLGLPEWQPGDGQQRAIDPNHIEHWDFGTVDAEADAVKPRSEEDIERIARAQQLWNDADDPRGTSAEDYLRSRALTLHADLAGTVLRFRKRTPWRNENTGTIERVPCLIAAFRSLDDNELVGRFN